MRGDCRSLGARGLTSARSFGGSFVSNDSLDPSSSRVVRLVRFFEIEGREVHLALGDDVDGEDILASAER